MPIRTMMPIRGIFSSFFLRINIRMSKTMVMMRVTMLKDSNKRFNTLKGLEVNCYSDIMKKASMFSMARGKNYLIE